MSGGGRCNFTNYVVEADNYISANPHFCKSALKRYTQWDFIAMVEQHGIEYEERKHGQLFCKDSAKQILAMLLEECEIAGVEIKTHCELHRVSVPNRQSENNTFPYKLSLKQGKGDNAVSAKIACQSLVVATGALSIPSLGGSGVGYELAQQFSLGLTSRRAGLVPFMFSDASKHLCEQLSGVSLEVEVSCNHRSFNESLLFTHRGLSGPVILQISNYWSPGDEIKIDLLPGLNVAQWLRDAKQENGRSLLKTLLHQKLGKSLVKEFQSLWWPEQAQTPLAEFSDQRLSEIGQLFNAWSLKPSATEGYRTAEVTLGGVDTNEISSKTMEAKNQSGLYFIGEVLDVSGHLGGFNFQWAWSSGYSAGSFV